jgi:LacI family transcriptional regulator
VTEETPRTPPRATLHQVADLAGVSLKTASRALRGEPHLLPETRDRVVDAARRLGYRRNTAASLLAAGRLSDSVGLITGDLTNPFYSALAEGLEAEIRSEGFHLTVASSREQPDVERLVARSLGDSLARAVVVVSAMADHASYQELQDRGVPVVFVDRAARGIEADSVVLDDVSGGESAARHLLRHGHRRIAFIGDHAWLPTYRDRLRGVSAVLEEHGIQDGQRWVRSDAHDIATARSLAAELLDAPDGPTAVIAGNNRVTLGVIEEISTRPGLRTPPAVIGFDDFEGARALGTSVVATDPQEMGRRAGRLALDRLADRELPARTVTLATTLIPRGSGERPPA